MYFSSTSSSNGSAIDHADVRARHESRHRPGADAEQGLAGDAAPALGSDPAGRRRCRRSTPASSWSACSSPTTAPRFVCAEQPAGVARARPDPAHSRRRQCDPVRLRVLDAHLARRRQAARLQHVGVAQVLAAVRAQNVQIAAGSLGARTGDQGNRLHRDRGCRRPLLDARAVREHHPAREHRRHQRAPEGCRARRARTIQLRPQRALQQPGRRRFRACSCSPARTRSA